MNDPTAPAPFVGPEPPTCQQSLVLGGGSSRDCGWAFAYRSDAALQAFERLNAQVTTCATPIAQDDPDVSHPDSYDLRLFTLNQGAISISLKDKGALAQTYIFLRAAGAAQD